MWLAFVLSEGDHRLARVEPWVKEQQRTLRRCMGIPVTPCDLTVDDLQGRVVRVDTTTAAAYVTPEDVFQLGHSKGHRPELPQITIAMAVLDPLGLPLMTTVVAGSTADDRLYLPAIATVRQVAQVPGLPYVGDCTMAALRTSAEIVAHQDSYLCPLSAK